MNNRLIPSIQHPLFVVAAEVALQDHLLQAMVAAELHNYTDPGLNRWAITSMLLNGY
jgi:hypothetical protein